MSALGRRSVALVTAALVAAGFAGQSAVAAPSREPLPPVSEHGRSENAGKGDSDGDKISDDLEAALADLAPQDRVSVIVQGATPGQARRAAPSLVLDHRYEVLPAFSGSVTAGQVNALSRLPFVTRVELDGLALSLDAAGDRDYGVEASRQAGLAPDGTLDGNGIGICIIDTGIDPNHEQISGRVVGWRDFTATNAAAPMDDHGHGTHVASIAAGDGTGGPNAAVYGGVARGASLIGAKVLTSAGSGQESDIAAAIDWCSARPDVKVLSLSLGSPPGDGNDAVSQAANNAVTLRNKVVVVAAGNSGDDRGTVSSPGVATHVITVGAGTDYSVPVGDPGHDTGLVLAGFSSRGPTANVVAPLKPDVIAPGVSVVAAKSGTVSSYLAYSGTSMATPFVAGVVALGLEAAPGATATQVKAALQASARDAGIAGADNDWGHGLVDARAFIAELQGAAPATAPGPEHSFTSGSVADGATASVPIEVTTSGQPLGVSVRLDGSLTCSLTFFGLCLAWEWSPDLDLALLNPSGQVVAESQCPLGATNNNCGGVGRWETLGVSSAAEGTWTLRVIPFGGAPNSGKGGTFDVDVFGAIGTTTPPPANVAPVADAGPDQGSVTTGTVVTLDGSASQDPDGDPLTFAWAFTTRPSGSAASLSGAGTDAPRFTPDVAGTYVAELTVTDGRGGSSADSVSVTAQAPPPPPTNEPPVADAGPDQTVTANRGGTARVRLDGRGSSDPEGGALTYEWRRGTTLISTKATVSERRGVGAYTYTLKVTDAQGASATDIVNVTVVR